MGRRKAKKAPPKPKLAMKLVQVFTCPFCQHEKSCEVKMDKIRNTGYISCSQCLEDFQTSINHLSVPIDVFNEWIDECEKANMESELVKYENENYESD